MFAIDCSESMQALYDDPKEEGAKTSRLLYALEAAMQIQKRKVVVGPNDAAGILLFNTVSSHHFLSTRQLQTPIIVSKERETRTRCHGVQKRNISISACVTN